VATSVDFTVQEHKSREEATPTTSHERAWKKQPPQPHMKKPGYGGCKKKIRRTEQVLVPSTATKTSTHYQTNNSI